VRPIDGCRLRQAKLPAIQKAEIMNANDLSDSQPSGLVTVASAHTVAQTLERLETALRKNSVTIFAQIDHAAGAGEAGLPLRPTTVVLFGNPQVGTPIMQAKQTIGIDLPMKVLVWEDEKGKAWLSYNNLEFLARRHQVADRKETVAAMNEALAKLAKAATAP
jgi:uncharacterized protein (DUF302 family)